MGFSNKSRNSKDMIFAAYNSKTGLIHVSHKEKPTDPAVVAEKVTSESGNVTYVEKHEQLENVQVRKVAIKETPSFDDRNVMEKELAITLRDADDGQGYYLKFRMGPKALKALALINAADLSKPMTFGGGAFPEGSDKKDLKTGEVTKRAAAESFLIGAQGGVKLAAKFSDKPDFQIPKVEKVEVKNGKGVVIKTVPDSTNRDDFIVELASEMTKKVEAAVALQKAPAPAPAPAPVAPSHDDTDAEGADDAGLTVSDLGVEDGGASDAEQFRQG